MAENHYDLIVAGNGVAGCNAAFTARKYAPDLSILMFGEEPYTEYAAGALPDYLSGHLTLDEVMIKTEDDYTRHRIELHKEERVLSFDAKAKTLTTDQGRTYSYGKLVLATGSAPIRLLKMEGTSLPGNYVLKSIRDVEEMTEHAGKRAVVVGSGAIGLEGALALKERGVEEVTIVELLDWLTMKSLDQVTADLLENQLTSRGIHVLTGENVMSVQGEHNVTGVVTSKREIPCDMVLWAIGVRPVTDLAVAGGVELGQARGIRVDEYMRTNLPDVYACGDCTESIDRLRDAPVLNMLWEAAARQGIVAGCHCAGVEKEFDGSCAVLITYVGDSPIVAFGMTEKDLEGTDYRVLEEKTDEFYRRILMQDGKIKGVQMINTMEGAADLLAQMQKGMPVDEELLMQGDTGRYPAIQASLAAYIRQAEI